MYAIVDCVHESVQRDSFVLMAFVGVLAFRKAVLENALRHSLTTNIVALVVWLVKAVNPVFMVNVTPKNVKRHHPFCALAKEAVLMCAMTSQIVENVVRFAGLTNNVFQENAFVLQVKRVVMESVEI